MDNDLLQIIKPNVKDLYMKGHSVPKICEFFADLQPSTVYYWVKEEKWKEQRESKVNLIVNTPDLLMQALDTMLVKTLLEGKDSEGKPIIANPDSVAKITDSVVKITASIKRLSKDRDNLGSIIFTMKSFTEFMNEQDANIYDNAFREKLVKLITGFSTQSIKQYSPKNFNN